MDLEERVAALRLGGDLAQPLGRDGVGGVRPEPEMEPAGVPVLGVEQRARLGQQHLPACPARGDPGTSKMPGV